MTRSRSAHRAEFSVRCACGNVFHTDDAQIGKQLRCRCGRMLTVVRPVDEYVTPDVPPPNTDSPRQRQTKTRSREPAARERATRASGARARDGADVPPGVVMPTRRSSLGARRGIVRTSWGYAALVLATWALLVFASERFLPATLLAYGPRWVVAFPLLVLLPLAVMFARRALVPLGLATAMIVWPIMGFRVSAATFLQGMPASPRKGTFRVLTFNTFGGIDVAARFDEVLVLHADIMGFQECGNALFARLQQDTIYQVRRFRNSCTASRWPITVQDTLPQANAAMVTRMGNRGTALAAHYETIAPTGPISLINVHLETARKGLQAFGNGDGVLPDDLGQLGEATRKVVRPDQTTSDALAINTAIRASESQRVAAWARSLHGDRAPQIVMGDFNLPVESTIFARYWHTLTDAFESAGTGFGFTKHEGKLLRIRIDHLLSNGAIAPPVGAWVGPDIGSDHRPVIADYKWP